MVAISGLATVVHSCVLQFASPTSDAIMQSTRGTMPHEPVHNRGHYQEKAIRWRREEFSDRLFAIISVRLNAHVIDQGMLTLVLLKARSCSRMTSSTITPADLHYRKCAGQSEIAAFPFSQGGAPRRVALLYRYQRITKPVGKEIRLPPLTIGAAISRGKVG